MAGRRVILWGGAGQAKVLRPIIENEQDEIGLVFDRNRGTDSPFPDIPCVHAWNELVSWVEANTDATIGFAVAVGGANGRDRLEIHGRLINLGLEPLTLVHPRAWVAASAKIGAGGQICAMAAFGEEAEAGRQCIINTGASVDHECRLGDGVHIMPGAVLAGCVHVGDCTTIGANATVLPRVRIGADAQIAAGAVVVKDVPEGITVIGNPANPMRQLGTNPKETDLIKGRN